MIGGCSVNAPLPPSPNAFGDLSHEPPSKRLFLLRGFAAHFLGTPTTFLLCPQRNFWETQNPFPVFLLDGFFASGLRPEGLIAFFFFPFPD